MERKILAGDVEGGIPVHKNLVCSDILTDPCGRIEDLHCLKVVRSGKDADGIFTTVSFYDINSVLRKAVPSQACMMFAP